MPQWRHQCKRELHTYVRWTVVILLIAGLRGGHAAAETLLCNATTTGQDSLERWSTASGLTFSRDSHAAAVLNGKIWVVGGVSTPYYTQRLEHTTVRSDVVSTADGKTWEEVLEEAPFRRRFGHSLTTFADASDRKQRLVLLGGFSPEPATDVWTSLDGATWQKVATSSPWTGRGYHCTVTFQNRLWVMGGSPMNNDVWSTGSVLNGPWEKQADVPWSPRSAHACTSHKVVTNATQGESSTQEFVFLMGGWDESSMQDVWRMDAAGTWTQLLGHAPWDKRAWHSVVSFDSRTNGDIELGPRLWLIGGGIIGSGVHKMYPHWDVWYTRNGSVWVEASSDASGVSTADWSMITTREKQTCLGKWGQSVVAFHRKVARSYYCSSTCINEANTTSLANQIIPVCDATKMLPDPPVQKTLLIKSSNSMVTRTINPDGCGLCYGAASERYVNSTQVPALYLIGGNVGTQKVKDVFYSNDAMLCEKNGVICSNKGTCTQGGTCLCVTGKIGQFCESDSAYTVIDDGNCFPPTARVTMRDGTQRAIGAVGVGDYVLTLDQRTSRAVFAVVYYLPHDSHPRKATKYIRVSHTALGHESHINNTVRNTTAAARSLSMDGFEPIPTAIAVTSLPIQNLERNSTAMPLEITPQHLLYVVAPEWRDVVLKIKTLPMTDRSIYDYMQQISARELRTGDLLVTLAADESTSRSAILIPIAISRVTALDFVRRNGAVTLYTTTGTLFVDGVLCSNFADLYWSPWSLLAHARWTPDQQPAVGGAALTRAHHTETSSCHRDRDANVRCRDALPFALFAGHRLLFTWLPFPATAQLLRRLMDLLVLPVLRCLWPRHVAHLVNSDQHLIRQLIQMPSIIES